MSAPCLDNDWIFLSGGLLGVGSPWEYRRHLPAAPHHVVSHQKHVRWSIKLNLTSWKKDSKASTCAVLFYFNYTCRVTKKKKIQQKRMNWWPLLFTHSQYNFTTYLHVWILWRPYIHLALCRHVAQYLNKNTWQIWFICAHWAQTEMQKA